MPDVELHVPADPAYVSLARLVVTTAARQAGMADDRVEDLKIAVSEATTNAIHSHRRAGSGQPVVLSFGPSGDGSFEVMVRDAGPGFDPGFDPADAQPPSLDPDLLQEGGLGVTLIRELSDHVQFVRDEGMAVNMRFGVDLGNGTA